MKHVEKFSSVNITDVETLPFNPNEQSEATFNELVKDIKEEGFDEPIQIAPKDIEEYKKLKDKYDKGFWIVGGEHRYRAVKLLGESDIIASIKMWDMNKIKLMVVRRNRLRGEFNPKKFTQLVNDVAGVTKLSIEDIKRKMGFFDDKDWGRLSIDEKGEWSDKYKDAIKETKRELNAVENLSMILNKLFIEYGDTLKYGYMFFMFGTKLHLMLQMDKDVQTLIDNIIKVQKNMKSDINNVLVKVLTAGYPAIKLSKAQIDKIKKVTEVDKEKKN